MKFNKLKGNHRKVPNYNTSQKNLKRKHFKTTSTHPTTFYVLPQEVNTPKPRIVHFDHSTVQAGIDNRCTASISNNPSDFIGKLTSVTVNLESYKGEEMVEVMKGILQWKWQDDDGNMHTFKIPNSCYDPN